MAYRWFAIDEGGNEIGPEVCENCQSSLIVADKWAVCARCAMARIDTLEKALAPFAITIPPGALDDFPLAALDKQSSYVLELGLTVDDLRHVADTLRKGK